MDIQAARAKRSSMPNVPPPPISARMTATGGKHRPEKPLRKLRQLAKSSREDQPCRSLRKLPMNYREAEAVTVSCFAERMENIRRLSTYDSDALSTGLYSPRSKGILSEYSDCPSQTMV